jgi:hypothetical protein
MDLFASLFDRLRLTQPYRLGSRMYREIHRHLEFHALGHLTLQAYRKKWNSKIMQFQYQVLDAEAIRCLDQVYYGISRGSSYYLQIDRNDDRLLISGPLGRVESQISQQLRQDIEQLTH